MRVTQQYESGRNRDVWTHILDMDSGSIDTIPVAALVMSQGLLETSNCLMYKIRSTSSKANTNKLPGLKQD